MAGRYEILDILAQDKSGIVFHAEERESGRSVVLRRFFPYGPEGGGLQEAERAAYMAALERVRDLRHPTLRTIIDGGCDPVDGMPFLVSEWVEGQRLGELLKSRALSPGSTKALLTHALEASKELSQVFDEEAVWVETTPDSVILPVEGETLTFWICPIKWLSTAEQRGGLLPLAKLAEKALHWRGKPVAGTGEGIGSWVKAVRENPYRWNLDEALQALHEPLTLTGPPAGQAGNVPTIPMKAAQKAATPDAPKKKSVLPVLLAVLTALVVVGGAAGGFFYYKSRGGKMPGLAQESAVATPKEATSALDFGSRDLPKPEPKKAEPKLAETKPSALPAVQKPADAKAAPKKPAPPKAPPAAKPDKELVGKVVEVEDSKSGETLYLKLDVQGKPQWVGVWLKKAEAGFGLPQLEAFKGKTIRVTGEIRDEKSHRGQVLHVTKASQIVEQK
ncbi:hypothetical protein [Luteolibacter sp. Populi]|uniref:hypothetical protein n=1 Tax=Luteolibacter sp. Populi TaxID=3230487 RepID=UPI00346764D0